MTSELESKRREYRYAKLSRSKLAESPFDQFSRWMDEAIDAEVQDPTAMCVATVGSDGKPSQRIVLLKRIDSNDFIFYTNTESRKAKEISENEHVSLHFAWLEIDRQIHIEGSAERISAATALKYFITRPRDSQLAAWASPQSRRISSRSMLENEFQRMQEKFSNKEIPLPSFWSGYRVSPERWEFWQGGERRLHDRFEYSPFESEKAWEINRLAP
ncbi:MAG: pyridoxamine 5'-phosphate oxidase [Gammaproteobacteria bacterium]|jgi:pyridoxamine 5'-phosphate oxidase|nr:pyridoxamine 5'-phosphate oxidase [Gammaproteobacteria bacterium]MBT3868641.1 pyridoxamine 5'-phosphate oxidase [Gammaproteobacteria bacterium]MBT4378689.1 pyridoxamine 5'-phosphate oxidase [Gammaproteobacteria bacterium]MBT4615304.1 pyridoxamine 5'-phosphate oxidase [Gammaproteobacteria bacterium]MBT5195972.1 pyridoxamine 5'-phosphate oxidase [Gammaproteobacteria bacterium]